MDALTADMVDGEYRAVCAEIGQLYVQRSEADATLRSLDLALESKRQALFQVVARHRALAHNEASQVAKKAPGELRGVERGK